jgi:hypothetical protein
MPKEKDPLPTTQEGEAIHEQTGVDAAKKPQPPQAQPVAEIYILPAC